MKTNEFLDVKSFLEKMIENEPSNSSFLDAYLKLLGLKSTYDLEIDKKIIEKEIKFAELNTEWNKTYNSNYADVQKNLQDNTVQIYQKYYSTHHQIPFVFSHSHNH